MKVYSPSDVASLLKLKTATLRKYSIMPEESINNVINLTSHSNETNEINNDVTTYKNDIQELKVLVHNQNELIKGLAGRLDKQQEYINNSIKERDNESLEAQKQIAIKEEKRGFFALKPTPRPN